MKKYLLFFVAVCSFCLAQELTNTQKSYLNNALQQIERAEKETRSSQIQNRLRYAEFHVTKLLKEAGDNPDVQSMKKRYDLQQQRVNEIKAKEFLEGTIRSLDYPMKRWANSPKMPEWQKKSFVTSLEKLQQLTKDLQSFQNAENAKLLTQAQETATALRKLLGMDAPSQESSVNNSSDNNTQKTETKSTQQNQPDQQQNQQTQQTDKQQSQEITTEEKKALSSMRSILSYSKRYLEQAEKIQKSLQDGQNIPSSRYADTVRELVKFANQSVPHMEILAKNPKAHQDTINAYVKLFKTAQFLSQAIQQQQIQEREQAVVNSLKQYESYMAKVLQIFQDSPNKIGQGDPTEQVRRVISSIDFHIEKMKAELVVAKKYHGDHPRILAAVQKFQEFEQKYQNAIPQMRELASKKHCESFLQQAQALQQQKSDQAYMPNNSLKQAQELYNKVLDYLQEHGNNSQNLQNLQETTRQQRQECIKNRVIDACQACKHAIEADYFNWIGENIESARSIAGDDPELKKIIDSALPEIIEIACKKADDMHSKNYQNNFYHWNGRCWEHLSKYGENSITQDIIIQCGKTILQRHFAVIQENLKPQEGDPRGFQNLIEKQQKYIGEIVGNLSQLQTEYQTFLHSNNDAITALQQNIANKIAAEEEALRIAQEKFVAKLSSEQQTIYEEWEKRLPDEHTEDENSAKWVYIKKEKYRDSLHIYIFGPSGKLLHKDVKKQGGGIVKGYHNDSWGEIANIYKDGKVMGYHDGSWREVMNIKENGQIYGYYDGSWRQVGEFKSNDKIYGYHNGSWGEVAQFNGKSLVGWGSGSSWGEIAEFKDEGKIYGYRNGSWGEIAKMDVASEKYRLAVLLFYIYGRR